ncbi:hypothetical protein QVD17_36492 [Tagetes erecta]|uniref:Uncharacterized protein n=1 Tax=Tagetes erecta TaxID=13708 RepID=A0AAD8JWG2_TARER|nr:hypothetical protein QVD17_36492 [Tagetes erecta]
MAKSSDQKHDDESNINEASNSNNTCKLQHEQDLHDHNISCQTPTSDDHKIQHNFPPAPPRKRLAKRRRRSSDDIEFFEKTRREEVDAFFHLFTLRGGTCVNDVVLGVSDDIVLKLADYPVIIYL